MQLLVFSVRFKIYLPVAMSTKSLPLSNFAANNSIIRKKKTIIFHHHQVIIIHTLNTKARGWQKKTVQVRD